MEKSVVRVENLSHRYNVQWAIRDINFEIDQRGVVGCLLYTSKGWFLTR